MKFTLITQEIERHDTPNNSSVNYRIKSINKVVLGFMSSQYKPEKEEVIKFGNENYEVVKVIRVVKRDHEEFFVQVVPYNTSRFESYGSNSWYEDIPLVIDIE
jgi:hypothetical protein